MELPPESPRKNGDSPEFEFWMVGKNPSIPPPAQLSADELFSDGVVLPLRNIHLSPPEAADDVDAEAAQPLPDSSAPPAPDLPAVTFKWKDMFKAAAGEIREKRKLERKVSVGGNAELNINIWPFSRSRSAGHAPGSSTGPWSRARGAGRKASSAPCSRSNSRGESSRPVPTVPSGPPTSSSIIRRWVPGQGRVGPGNNGIRLGRASPVWQLRRSKLQSAEHKDKQAANAGKKKNAGAGDAAGAKVLNVNTCIGYRNKPGCGNAGEEGNAAGNNTLFGLRTLFSKKVY